MICPYNNFKHMDCDKCAARMWVKNPLTSYEYMKVCAIAYNGGSVTPKPEPIYLLPKEGCDHATD